MNELILIVEDNPKNLKLVRDTLQVKGYQTIEAETGERACSWPASGAPPLDVQLKEEDGHGPKRCLSHQRDTVGGL